jgi:hypothetical protein
MKKKKRFENSFQIDPLILFSLLVLCVTYEYKIRLTARIKFE